MSEMEIKSERESEAQRRREAVRLFQAAYKLQMAGQFEAALALYSKSIDAYPTAEGYTFRGWTYSMLGRLDEAIAECHRAIEVDPQFGNPYNDIGAYLIEKGQPDLAVSWLERALRAPRYECYHYANYNLGRVYEQRGELLKAIRHYSRAWELEPKYEQALKAVRRLQERLN